VPTGERSRDGDVVLNLDDLTPHDLRELASAREAQLAAEAGAAAHAAMLEAIAADADPETCRSFDRRLAVGLVPPECRERVDELIAELLPLDSGWCIRGVAFVLTSCLTDGREVARIALKVAAALWIDEQLAVRVLIVALRDLHARGAVS